MKRTTAKPDWTGKLSKPIGRFRTLSDIRDFILREFPDGPPPTWEQVGREAIAAARNGNTADVEAALALVLMFDPRGRQLPGGDVKKHRGLPP